MWSTKISVVGMDLRYLRPANVRQRQHPILLCRYLNIKSKSTNLQGLRTLHISSASSSLVEYPKNQLNMPAISQCCATGSLHAGTPKGEVTKLHGLDCYITNPPSGTSPKGIVVIIPDAFGIALPNNRILADAYAEKIGAQVLLPDFMDGTSTL